MQEFKNFVVKSALCEMIMAFETTLDELYIDLWTVSNQKNYNTTEHKRRIKKFLQAKFEDKLNKIEEILTNTKGTDFWKNLKYIRNCIEHNYSKVNHGTIKLIIPVIEVKFIDEKTKKRISLYPRASFSQSTRNR